MDVEAGRKQPSHRAFIGKKAGDGQIDGMTTVATLTDRSADLCENNWIEATDIL